jgi:hypothetical protein
MSGTIVAEVEAERHGLTGVVGQVDDRIETGLRITTPAHLVAEGAKFSMKVLNDLRTRRGERYPDRDHGRCVQDAPGLEK